jgi:N-acetyl-gamma-glutamyl-phosphate/LysW-gamma-L-alpha-aminoadipyl-6-phosphate reductase
MKVSVLGGAGYAGGELVRLLLGDEETELVQVTSRRLAGRPIASAHPNLRRLPAPAFTDPGRLERVDVLFCAMPPGEVAERLGDLVAHSGLLVDLSPDFRLRDDALVASAYRPAPGRGALAATFAPGLPELYRDRIRGADRIAVPGCMATAAILALRPLAEAGLVDGEVLVDARTGSSGSGARPTAASHHAERDGAMRVYKPTGHRHEAEIVQACEVAVRMTVTGVPRVRGVQVVLHVRTAAPVTKAHLWSLYRGAYADEPFVRLVAQGTGMHRLPEPAVLSGTNFCDIGFEIDGDGRRVVVVAALDNLVKGAAGGALQSANVALDRPEDTGLRFVGLHPL